MTYAWTSAPAAEKRRDARPLLFAVAALMAVSVAGAEAATGMLSGLLGGFPAQAAHDQGGLTIALDDPIPQDLIAATQGPLAARQVEGEEARLANAALPFSAAPAEPARPFDLRSAAASDQARALQCLTQAVYYEAGFEPIEGRRAVAQVVLNRLRHPAFPKTVCGVVYQGSHAPGCQFSFTCDGSVRRAPAQGAWDAAARIAREALAGHVVGAVGHATHYHADYVSPYWAPKLTKLQQLGAHIFYRWPGQWGRGAAFRGRYAGNEAGPASAALAAAGNGDTGTGATPIALPPDPTERRAANDLGGRLDVTKGWTLSIPDPTTASASLHKTTTAQQGAAETRTLAAALPNGIRQ